MRIVGIYNYYPRVGNWQSLKILKTIKKGTYSPIWWVQQNPLTIFGKSLRNPKKLFWRVTHYPQDYSDVNYYWNRQTIRVDRPRLGLKV